MPQRLIECDAIAFSPDDVLMSHLSMDGRIAKHYMDKVIEYLDLPPHLDGEPTEFMSWPGHPTLVVTIREPHWRTSPMIKTDDGRLLFPSPVAHHNIHFEIQIQLWTGAMTVALHYETNPFRSRVKLGALTDPQALSQYYMAREEFIKELAKHCTVPDFELTRRPLQIGKAAFHPKEKTVAEVTAWLRPVLDQVSDAIDISLRALQDRWGCVSGQASTLEMSRLSESEASSLVLDDQDDPN